MAERKATNKYYPPDWDPSKGSINTFVGQHPLRDRARKLGQGILIVRFELPFNIWCLHCNKHVGMGTRYNAEKKKVGKYHSTPIWSFRMKCHLCSGWLEIRTDPANAAYVVESGARIRVEEFDVRDAETFELGDESVKERMQSDPFFAVEHVQKDLSVAQEKVPFLTKLHKRSDRDWADPYENYRKLRKTLREEKKVRLETEKECQALSEKLGIGNMKLFEENEEDRMRARFIMDIRDLDTTPQQAHDVLAAQSIFPTGQLSLKSQLSTSSTFRKRLRQKPAVTPEIQRAIYRSTEDPFAVTTTSTSKRFLKGARHAASLNEAEIRHHIEADGSTFNAVVKTGEQNEPNPRSSSASLSMCAAYGDSDESEDG
ncbi:hypothetical protein HDU85_001670 [Gaertneriomyces sp. JEL0708]|nr:hypothetical protein HDU85_001670 [Gaertneriomyces sp. JEL0708]